MVKNSWDVVVVGAGSSGATLAARLAARARNVLLLEAGPDYRSAEMAEVWRSPNPGRALRDPTAWEDLVWPVLDSRRSEKQSPALYWRGRGVGGSSSINGQIAIRPPMQDFEDWVSAGCQGWSPREVLPYFAKLEDDEDFGDAPYHGRGGPIPIYRTPQEKWGSVDAALAAGALAAGYGWASDVNAPEASGVSPYPINSRAGQRVSTNDAYLEPARSLSNLTIRGGSLVDRVIFSGSRAIGVQVLVNGAAVVEYADLVVLSAGAIHSPAILMRSGIGPAGNLRSVGIHVIQDLPVGQGLQDHPVTFVGIPLNKESAARTVDDRHTNVCVRYTSGDPNAGPYDMMLVSANQNVISMERADLRFGAGAIGLWLNQVYSQGYLRLTSADPTVDPEIHQRMLSDPRDLARMRTGVRTLVELVHGSDVAQISQDSPIKLNGALHAALDDDADLNNFLLSTIGDAQHATSTCHMGSPADSTAVIDPECRVLGIDALCVVDASIFPTVPRANTHLAAVMAGELIADRLD